MPRNVVYRFCNTDEVEVGLRSDKRSSDPWFYSMTSQWDEMRQTIASARGDLDLIIALEEKKHLHMQDTLGIASRLLDAERAAEALDWVRRPVSAHLTDQAMSLPHRGLA